MRTTNTFGAHFLIRQDKLKAGKSPIYARITVNTERALIGLKQWIDSRSWDPRKGTGKRNSNSLVQDTPNSLIKAVDNRQAGNKK